MSSKSINGQITCDSMCPNSYHMDAMTAQNYGCLPSYYEVQQMLKEGKIWMCHSNPTVVCSAVGDRNAVGDRINEY
jgi:hypothetical protein